MSGIYLQFYDSSFPLGSYISKKPEKFLRIVSVFKAWGYTLLFKNMYIFLTPSPLKFFMTTYHPLPPTHQYQNNANWNKIDTP